VGIWKKKEGEEKKRLHVLAETQSKDRRALNRLKRVRISRNKKIGISTKNKEFWGNRRADLGLVAVSSETGNGSAGLGKISS